MKTIIVEIKQEHFGNWIWGDKDCNPLSLAIEEALGVSRRPFCLRTGHTDLDPKYMAPIGFTRIHMPAHLYGLWNKLHDGYGLEAGTKFELQVPEEWINN